MPARDKINEWIKDAPVIGVLYRIGIENARRKKILDNIRKAYRPDSWVAKIWFTSKFIFLCFTYWLFHILDDNDAINILAYNDLTDEYSRNIQRVIAKIVSDKGLREISQMTGAMAYQPLKQVFEYYGRQETIDTDEFLNDFYGILTSLPMVAATVSTLGRLATGGQIDNLGEPIDKSYFSLGLGFIGWQGLSPLMNESVLAPLTREAKRTFRSERFGTRDILDLYALNKVSYARVAETFRDSGFREEDIPLAIELARKNLSRTEIQRLFELNKITQAEAIDALRSEGLRTEDINNILYLWQHEKTDTNKSASLATVKKARKLNIISDSQFIEFLTKLNLSKEAIQLELAILNFDKEVEEKELSLSQLKQAFNLNKITPVELKLELKQQHYSEENVQLILNTWIAQRAPKILRINQSTIKTAIAKQIITPEIGLRRLIEIGYLPEEAKIIIDTISIQTATKIKAPSDAQILKALRVGIVTSDYVRESLLKRGYSTTDAALLISLTLSTEPLELSPKDIVEAYVYDALTIEQATGYLSKAGATQDFIRVSLDTATKRKQRLIKRPTSTDIAKWVRAGALSSDDATVKLTQAGYTPIDARLFIENIGVAAPIPLNSNEIEEALQFSIITADEAYALLQKTGLTSLDATIKLQTIQASIKSLAPQISPAALVSATRNGLLTIGELKIRLENLGLSPENIDLNIKLAELSQPEAETKLTKEDILKGWRVAKLSPFEAISALEAKGYSIEEAVYLLSIETRNIEKTEIVIQYKLGIITQAETISYLLDAGFTELEISDWLGEVLQ